MELTVRPSNDPKFYFSDEAYTDYRELICFERPACFVLHYYFGFENSRLWLFDRFAFEFADGELKQNSNALAEFFHSEGIVSNVALEGTFDEFLKRELSDRTALIAPLETKIGSSTVVTSYLLEKVEGGSLLCTCLRGDDFFIAKPIPIGDIENRLHRENGSFHFHKLTVPDHILAKRVSASSTWNEFGLSSKWQAARDRFLSSSRASGEESLKAYLASRDLGSAHYSKKVAEGFVNVMLVEVFWPMLFAYSPFVVFLRHALREGVSLPIGCEHSEIVDLISKITNQAELITNVSYLFGRQPTEANYQRVIKACSKMAELYGLMETKVIRGGK